jgi:steroid delta-isomerase-like uncharacterized protein
MKRGLAVRTVWVLAVVGLAVLVLAACMPITAEGGAGGPTMASGAGAMAAQEEQSMAIVQRFYDEFAAGNAAVISDVHPETITMHYAGMAEDVPTAALEADLAAIKAANPDLHAEIHDMFAAGDYVFTELTWSGTHTGDLFGIPATNNPIVHNGIVVRRLEDGKIVESWEMWDDLTLMAEFGLTPSWDELVGGE